MSSVSVREKRLHTILHYRGDAVAFNESAKEAKLKIGQFGYSQCGNCQEGCAFGEVYAIRDAAVVAHSPIGCYSTVSASCVSQNSTSKGRGLGAFRHSAICSNITEGDTIYGGVIKLKNAIKEAYKRYSPKVIFITTSCASGIIGDDVESVATEMTDELGIPVSVISCEGFKSKIWSTGFDTAFHALLEDVVVPPVKKRNDIVNVFNFEGVKSLSPLLALLGLKAQYLPSQTDVETFSHISEAAASATICETLGTYINHELNRRYGVPEVKSPAPYGIRWTDRWLREVARITGKEDIVEEKIEAEHKRIELELKKLKKELAGKRVYVFAGDAYAHNMASVASDLDMEVIGVTTYHHDQRADSKDINTLNFLVETVGNIQNYTVCNKQPYQVIRFLKKLKPDVLIVRHQGLAVHGYKLGIPTIFEADSNLSAGYDGIIEFGHRILRVFKTRKLIQNLAEHTELPYTDWWLNEDTDPFYFVKEG